MPASLKILTMHREKLLRCRRCPQMESTPVPGPAVRSKILLVGQAPGVREPLLGRPFAWTAGKKLFKWFSELGLTEEEVRRLIYFAAVCRCFPGKAATGGDRTPDPKEIENCGGWLNAEIQLLKPQLIIPVGRMAIAEFMPCMKLDGIIGKKHGSSRAPGAELIPLPHPSGASTWVHRDPGKSLLRKALGLIGKHPAFVEVRQRARKSA